MKTIKNLMSEYSPRAMSAKNISWKTTLVGILCSVYFFVKPIVLNGSFDLKTDWINIVGAIVIGVWGYFAKDADVTGLPKFNSNNNSSNKRI